MTTPDERVVIWAEEGGYVGWVEDQVGIVQDPTRAFVYFRRADNVQAQIDEVFRLYGKRWTAMPLAEALAKAKSG